MEITYAPILIQAGGGIHIRSIKTEIDVSSDSESKINIGLFVGVVYVIPITSTIEIPLIGQLHYIVNEDDDTVIFKFGAGVSIGILY